MKKNLFGISMLTIIGLYALLSIVVLGVCLIIKIPVVYGIGFSIIALIIQFLIAPFLTDLTMKWFYKVSFNCEIPDYLKEFINDVCTRENIKTPKIGIINDSAPNAFTYGRFKNDARLVITRGILEILSPDEVKCVVGHEFGHIVHMDMLFMTVAELVPLVLYFVYETLINNNSDDDNKGNTAIVAIVAYVLYIISQYIVLWLSRTREYYADSYSIEATKNPNGLASSLVKIGFGLSIKSNVNEENNDNKKKEKNKKISISKIGALGLFDAKTSKSLIVSTNNKIDDKTSIKNAMKWEMWNPWAIVYELSSTHPLISKRLIEISKYSNSYNQEPFITFDLKQEESYVDDFFVELLIKYSPFISIILTILFCVLYSNENSIFKFVGIGGLITIGLSYIGFKRSHKDGYNKTNVRELLGEVKVSSVTSIPCILEGKVIGKGDPGCIFSEDFILQDETGIIFLDYNQPLFIVNKIFALFKSSKYIDQNVKIKGWYRRSPVPYVEILEMEVNGKVKKVFTYGLSKIIYVLFAVLFLGLIIIM